MATLSQLEDLLEPRMTASLTEMSRLDPKELQTKQRIYSNVKTQTATTPFAPTTLALHMWKEHGCIWRPCHDLRQILKNHDAKLHKKWPLEITQKDMHVSQAR